MAFLIIILGLYNETKCFLLPYIVYDGIRLIITILAFVFITVIFYINHIAIGVLSACIFQILSIVLVFIWITVLSAYLNISNISSNQSNSSEEIRFQERRSIQRIPSLGQFSNGGKAAYTLASVWIKTTLNTGSVDGVGTDPQT